MADPEAHPLNKLLRASHTVTGQNQCMVHAHGVCALGALVSRCGWLANEKINRRVLRSALAKRQCIVKIKLRL